MGHIRQKAAFGFIHFFRILERVFQNGVSTVQLRNLLPGVRTKHQQNMVGVKMDCRRFKLFQYLFRYHGRKRLWV